MNPADAQTINGCACGALKRKIQETGLATSPNRWNVAKAISLSAELVVE